MIARTLAATVVAVALLTGCTSTSAQPTDAPPTVTPPSDAPAPTDAALPAASVTGTVRPLVAWDAVDGAQSYRIAVVTQDGSSWAWEGEDAQVVLGGGDADRGGLGFRLTANATLFVTAIGADGTVISLDRYAVVVE